MAKDETVRTCATCACAQEIKHPVEVGRSQLVCRKDGLMVIQAAGRAPGLSYPPTDPGAVCFRDWRPIGALPGDNWRNEAMFRALAPLLETALKQTGINAKLATDIGRAMCDSAVAAGMFATPPDREKN